MRRLASPYVESVESLGDFSAPCRSGWWSGSVRVRFLSMLLTGRINVWSSRYTNTRQACRARKNRSGSIGTLTRLPRCTPISLESVSFISFCVSSRECFMAGNPAYLHAIQHDNDPFDLHHMSNTDSDHYWPLVPQHHMKVPLVGARVDDG